MVSCKNEITDEQRKAISEEGAYAHSAGRVNTLTVVMDNHLWEGQLGNIVREALAANVAGLPQEEPLFTLKQMPETAFQGFAKKSRCYISFKQGKNNHFAYAKNKFARPQLGVEITAITEEELMANFLSKKKEIIKTFKDLELNHKQSFFKNTLDLSTLKQNLPYTLQVPKTYRVAKDTANFVWLRRDIPQGSLNLTFYEVPKSSFKDSLSMVQNIIAMRNEISGGNIPVNEGGKFITEAAFSPFFKTTEIQGFPAYETKGTWEVENMFMAGPFINYVINDREAEVFRVLEGFVFAPTITKRDYIFELEAILKTIQFE